MVALVLVGTAVERGWRTLRTQGATSFEASWIWTGSGGARYTGPRAFYAVRDFVLDEVPPEAEVRVVADEEYLLYLNGRRVGSGVYGSSAPLDRYPVARYLATGRNRIAVVVRSSRGAGGLLLVLTDGAASRALVVSDGRWRSFETEHPGILEGWLPVEHGSPVVSLGRPPARRWGRVTLGPVRTGFDEAAGSLWQRQILTPASCTCWSAADQAARSCDELPQEAALGPVAVFDFGRQVTGYLVLLQRRVTGVPVGLVEVSGEPPLLRAWLEQRVDAQVVLVPGAARWRDAVPRTFRYLRVLGLPELLAAWVEPVDPAVLPRLPAAAPTPGGVFSLRPPPLRTPVEHEVWRELEGVPGFAGGEQG